MGRITYVPIDWDKESPTYGQELEPVTTYSGDSRPEPDLSPEYREIEQESLGEKIYPERIVQEENFLSKILSSQDYQDTYRDMPDRAAQVEFSARVIRGADPIDAARDIFESRANQPDVIRRDHSGVAPDGSFIITPDRETKHEKIIRDEELQDMEINHRKNMVDVLNGEL